MDIAAILQESASCHLAVMQRTWIKYHNLKTGLTGALTGLHIPHLQAAMKILQVIRQYLPATGGMETFVSNLCRQLHNRGHRCDVATLDYLFKSNEPLPHYQQIEGTDIIRLPSAGNPRYFFAPRLLEFTSRYDIIHVHGVDFFVDLLGASRKIHGRPVVLSSHGGFFHTPWFPAFKQAYFQTVTRLMLRGVDRIIADSPKDEKLFSKLSDRVTLVENGIDYPTFAAIEKKSGGSESLVFIGRISKNKRVDRLVTMLAQLHRQRPEATLTVIGPDWEGLQGDIAQQAAAQGVERAVNFTGVLDQEEMLEKLAQARLFVSASEYEAFGLSTVEAMASGTVPVINTIPAFSGFVENGETGFLTDFSDPEAAAKTIASVLTLPEERLREIGEAARKSAKRYDWSVAADKIVAIYEELLFRGH